MNPPRSIRALSIRCSWTCSTIRGSAGGTTPLAGSIWTGPNAIEHIRTGPAWANVVINQKQVFSDVTAGELPQVSWVIPAGQASDHAGINNGSGPSWVASIVNAIGTSKYWSDTAIFITWDEWGGWYDHVAPQIYDSYEYGFRVPLIVVSPYAKAGYVSHVIHDFGSSCASPKTTLVGSARIRGFACRRPIRLLQFQSNADLPPDDD